MGRLEGRHPGEPDRQRPEALLGAVLELPHRQWHAARRAELDGTVRQVHVGGAAGPKQTITVDDAYIIESIKLPEAKKVVGFEAAAMTAFDLPENKVKGLIAYMMSLADSK